MSFDAFIKYTGEKLLSTEKNPLYEISCLSTCKIIGTKGFFYEPFCMCVWYLEIKNGLKKIHDNKKGRPPEYILTSLVIPVNQTGKLLRMVIAYPWGF